MARLRRRLKSTSGNVALIFAIAAIPCAIAISVGVEWARVNNAKVKLDRATDSAALAAKKIQMENRDLGESMSKSTGEAGGRKAFTENAFELNQVAENAAMSVSWDNDESARVVGTADAKLFLGGFIGISTVRMKSLAVASSGTDSYYEIAMVLDNTGSMFEKDGRPKTRFTHLREAATAFVNASFDNMGMPNRLRFSVVPFAATVNIKSEDTIAWDPNAGPSSAVPDYGSRSMPSATLNRDGNIVENYATLSTMFAPVSWRGCISGNGESQTANDAPMSGMRWNAQPVPAHPHRNTWQKSMDAAGTCNNCTSSPPTPSPPGPTPPPPKGKGKGKGKNAEVRPKGPISQFANLSGTGRSPAEARFLTFGLNTRQAQACGDYPCTVQVCDPSQTPVPGINCWQVTSKQYGPDASELGRRNSFIPATSSCINGGYSDCTPAISTGTISACVSDPNEFAWNNGGGLWCSWVPPTNWLQFDDSIGPNVNCPMPMVGLTGSRPQILQTINRMSPVVGGTHNDVGLRWGLRTLSPRAEWANFFGNGGGKTPQAFGASNVKKAMVLITDGENTEAEDFQGYWGCSDTQAPGCTGAPNESTLDNRMLAWCDAIRNNNNVELYTVAVNISNPDAVNKLRTCAGSASRAFAVDASQLNETLETVAGSIFQLRLKE